MMSNYDKLIERLLSSGEEERREGGENLGRELIAELKMSHQDIADRECRDISKSKLKQFIMKTLETNSGLLLSLLKELLELLYLKESPLLRIVYQAIPSLLRLLFESKEVKSQALSQIAGVIQTNEMNSYRLHIREKSHIRRSPFVREVYLMHFGGKLEEEGESEQAERLSEREEPMRQVEQGNRQLTKMVLLFVVFQNLEWLGEQALQDYLKVVFVFCGGEMKDYKEVSSFYQLEKKNMFNCFRCSLGEQEMEWMLITLYELAMSGRKEKYQLLAAINMLYKKAANEAMFKYSEIAQSIIHLLEDQYTDIFS